MSGRNLAMEATRENLLYAEEYGIFQQGQRNKKTAEDIEKNIMTR